MGFCPNLKTSYQLSRRAKKEAKVVAQLLREGKFEKVSYIDILQRVDVMPVKDYETFESRTLVLKQIVEALKDANLNMIGVYGIGGAGKTTLVKKVALQVKEDKTFDVVLLAVVSQTPDLRRIQGEIADGLDLKLHAETVKGRALQLHERLKKEKKMLIILDDIWARLELEDVGIPFGSDHKGCKILMTSRDRNAVCCKMDAQKDFGIDIQNFS